MSCALFSTFQPWARLKPAAAVSQYALVRSPLSNGNVSWPSGVGTVMLFPSFVFIEP